MFAQQFTPTQNVDGLRNEIIIISIYLFFCFLSLPTKRNAMFYVSSLTLVQMMNSVSFPDTFGLKISYLGNWKVF